MSIPRIGQEVVVTYLEGDPDWPLVTGVVYNAEQMPAYTLPDEKTKSWIKTNTSKGGDGFNEIRFEDKKDKEQIFIHAQRNMDQRVKNDSMERVGGNRHLIVGNENGGDQREFVHGDKHLTVKGDHRELIEGSVSLTVAGWQDTRVKEDRSQFVGQMDSLRVEGSRRKAVKGNQSLIVGGDQHEKVGFNHALEANSDIHIKAGMKVVIEAGAELSLVGPGGFLHIGPGGVTLDGTMVWINSGGPGPASGSGSNPTLPPEVYRGEPLEPAEADNSKTGYKSCPD
jgi:type VI secretion system secreted protein VgrG